MASGRELCYLLLSGIMCCYLMAIPILAKPNIFTCSLLRIGLGFALCLCYSSILTKTNRISRIFNRGAKGIKRPSYTSPKSQIIICCGIYCIFFSLFKNVKETFIKDLLEYFCNPLQLSGDFLKYFVNIFRGSFRIENISYGIII